MADKTKLSSASARAKVPRRSNRAPAVKVEKPPRKHAKGYWERRRAQAASTIGRDRRPGRRPDPEVHRPPCPAGDVGRVRLAGYYGVWETGTKIRHRRARYECVPADCRKPHRFSAGSRRLPTSDHSHSGAACPNCEHLYDRHEGPATPFSHTFTNEEIAGALLGVGAGASQREAGVLVREHAQRYVFEDLTRGEVSRQNGTIAWWLDTYADPVIAALSGDRWPKVVVLDSQPMRKRRWHLGKAIPGGTNTGEILAVRDASHPRGLGELVLWLAGGKDADSWRDFLKSRPGEPAWVVADQDGGIAEAVKDVWRGATLYHCEGHLLKNAWAAAETDGIREHIYPRRGVAAAIPECLQTIENWDLLISRVRKLGTSKQALRSWISHNDALVRRQVALRRANPYLTRGNGAVEADLQWAMQHLGPRVPSYGNAGRLQRVLSLMALNRSRRASEHVYRGIIRDEVARIGRNAAQPEAARKACYDPTSRMASLDALITFADARNELARHRQIHQASRAAEAQRAQDALAALTAAGWAPPPRGHVPRQGGSEPRERRIVGGRMLSDFPRLVAEFAADLNPGLDPATIAAGTGTRLAWRCAKGHVFHTSANNRTSNNTACSTCTRRRAGADTCLAATHPHLVQEWDTEKNGSLTPEDVTFGSRRDVWWTCWRFGHSFMMRPNQRTTRHQNCSVCAASFRHLPPRERTGKNPAPPPPQAVTRPAMPKPSPSPEGVTTRLHRPRVQAFDPTNPAGWTVPEWLEPFEPEAPFLDEAWASDVRTILGHDLMDTADDF
jgi:hypothetical protein